MLLSQMGVVIIMGLKVNDHSNNHEHGLGILVVVFVCSFVTSFEAVAEPGIHLRGVHI